MNKPAIHRHTGSSKAGRRIAAANPLRAFDKECLLTQEQKDWNALVDAKREQKEKLKRASAQ